MMTEDRSPTLSSIKLFYCIPTRNRKLHPHHRRRRPPHLLLLRPTLPSMDYERIDKTSQPGGFSPSKLRAMLLGVEKLRKEEEELESHFTVRSDPADLNNSRGSSDGCKDVESSVLTDQKLGASRIRVQDEDTFEFHKSERTVHRLALASPFSKPTPSKWDDAEKWIASPTANRTGRGGGGQAKKSGLNRNPATKGAVEVTDGLGGGRNEPSLAKRESSGQKAVIWVPEPYHVVDSASKPAFFIDNSVHDSAVSLSVHDSSQSIPAATTFMSQPSAVQSVSMRDMGTEMTPIASNEPSRTGTPAKATTPTRSPTYSRHSTPGRRVQNPNHIKSDDSREDSSKELSEKELEMEVRREIMVLGTKLGKENIINWASLEQEETDLSSDKTVSLDQTAENIIDKRAAAWAEAEKAKYQSRFKREQIKIQAWENHQKAITEAEMKKAEVKAEKLRVRSQNKLMSKIAATRNKAEKKRAAAEIKRNQQAAKTEQQAEHIRRTGRIPSSSSCGLFS